MSVDHRRLAGFALAATLLVALGCSSDSTSPEERPAGDVTIARIAATAPLLQGTSVSFYAKRGEDREASLCYADIEGGCGEEFVHFKVNGQSLLTRPDGTPIAPGDSVLITISVPDPALAQVEFQPSGLRFNPLEPAELKIRYQYVDDDLDENGTVDDNDTMLFNQLAIWQQETVGGVFSKLTTAKLESSGEFEARVIGFSRYAIAY